MRALVALILVLSAASAEAASGRAILLANSIDGGSAPGLMSRMEGLGMGAVRCDAKSFEILKDAPVVVILGGQASPEGVGEIVGGILDDSERKSLTVPGASRVFVKKDVYAENQTLIIFAGYSENDTKDAWENGQDAAFGPPSSAANAAVTAPSSIDVEVNKNTVAFSFPVNVTNEGGAALEKTGVQAYLNGGIRLPTDPPFFDLAPGASTRVLVRLDNLKNLTEGSVVSVYYGSTTLEVKVNVTGGVNVPICNICAAKEGR